MRKIFSYACSAAVAQLVEQLTFDPQFKGSKPVQLARRGNRGNKKRVS
jgi:hypothetical protein